MRAGCASARLSRGLTAVRASSRPQRGRSRRVIPLPEVVVTALREHEKRQDDERAAAGDG
jgi:hypothetical protein